MTFAEAMAVADRNQGQAVGHGEACEALSVLRLAALSLPAPEWFDLDVAVKALARQYNRYGSDGAAVPRSDIEALAQKYGQSVDAALARYAPWTAT